MGGTKIEQPSPSPQPSTREAIQEWVSSLPTIYETQLKYAPMEAAQQVDIAQRYALPLGQAYYEAQKAMYPETSAIQEDLAKQATEGMTSNIPSWMKDEYLSNMRANLGTNIGSPIGADYTSRGVMQLQQDWQNYYRNLALSVAGRQPLAQPTSPTYSNYMSGFTPNSTMNYMASTYAPYVGAYANMYGSNAQMAVQKSQMPFQIMSGIGNMMGGIGKMAGG